jgi:pyridinium-3,5-bisthiocarboxylic acid mononucleotide nickel chelatase
MVKYLTGIITMKIAYFDCFSGISGDMCLGAIVDSGISIKELERELKKIPVAGYKLTDRQVTRSHFVARKIDVIQDSKSTYQGFKNWKDINKLINDSSLSDNLKQKGLNVFKRLFNAEAKVHGKSFNEVHLHELGALDCIVDIFGTVIGLNILDVEGVYSSPINLGSGIIKTQHGILPVPAPATAEILRNVPVYSSAVSSELTTPTGAAIIREISSGFGDIPLMEIEKIGTGAGSNNFKDIPNVLRIFIGNISTQEKESTDDIITVIETNIDDMNPQIFEYVIERLYKAGALDVYLTHIMMKKGRPGVKMTILCHKEKKDQIINIILKETSTIGLRSYEARRKILKREIKKINTEFGKIRVKESRLGNEILKISPEYEDCKRISKKLNIPLIEIMKKIK